jgi:hypothetical protein
MRPMSTAATTIIWAYTTAGDIATRVIDPAMLATIVDEVRRMRGVDDIEIEVAGQVVARSYDGDMADVDDYLATNTNQALTV